MTSDARSSLIAAAGHLFAEQGIDRPSLREITRRAGQRNTTALQYHFGDRDALLRAVLERHGSGVDSHRNALLDEADHDGDPSLRRMAVTLVLPLATRLDDRDGGADYLQIAGEVFARPRRFAPILTQVTARSMRRWSRSVEPHLPRQAIGRPLHRRFAALRFTHGELASRARERRRSDHQLFTNHLTDLVTAILAAPVSEETRRWIHGKDGSTPRDEPA